MKEEVPIAEKLAKEQREISVSQFFTKNNICLGLIIQEKHFLLQ